MNTPPICSLSAPPSPDTEVALFEVIRFIDASPRVSQRRVAESLGMSLGKANYCIRALIGKGFIKAENYRSSSNKRGYLYLLTPSGVAAKAELTRFFLRQKVREYEVLRIQIAQLREESLAFQTLD